MRRIQGAVVPAALEFPIPSKMCLAASQEAEFADRRQLQLGAGFFFDDYSRNAIHIS
jgi:hypothetical protein